MEYNYSNEKEDWDRDSKYREWHCRPDKPKKTYPIWINRQLTGYIEL